MSKAVIIIEDNLKEFERIKTIIDGLFVCRQNYNQEKFSVFRDNLRNSLIVNHSSPDLQSKMRENLLIELNEYCHENEQPVYLIDYLLDGSKFNSKIGSRFRDNILLEKLYPSSIVPVLFLTNAMNSTKLKIDDYCDKINNKRICDVTTKPDKDKWINDEIFKNKIISFIRNAYVIPQSKALELSDEQELHPTLKKIKDILNIPTFPNNVTSQMEQNLYIQARSLIKKVATDKNLLEDTGLIAILDKFNMPPHDAIKIRTFIENIVKYTKS